MAKDEGYPSRAAYKLIHVQKKYDLIHRGDTVVDLGAAPGGMSMVAARLVGSDGRVVSVDTEPLTFSMSNVVYLELDLFSSSVVDLILEALGGRKCDVLISDASPKFSGVKEIDMANQIRLTRRAVEIGDSVLMDGGSALLKAFECEEVKCVETALKRGFRFYRRVIPPPTLRRHSSELYLLCVGKRVSEVSLMVEENG